ncbi:beta-1,4-galactosyltransferase 3-like isoform X2 [Hypanus sabinus]|uniref:beta-1,4-galactosyltransferase 3-like isoform X2 n=1 Tax=Hypanus sabinus TaxID=79690 RepID=UPI0028C50C8B|nr:beta-1,4-galactosyltransferase 3-like isoform X2 [Hypanus sabinus]
MTRLCSPSRPCSLLVLALLQLAFVLFLYRRSLSNSFTSLLYEDDHGGHWDYTKTHDVYTNLSLITPGPDRETLVQCPAQSPLLVGPLTISFQKIPIMRKIERKNPYVKSGGRYTPPYCKAWYKTAILVPHRNREPHLRQLLYYLHPFLQRQQLQYAIYVIHQTGNRTFNRAKLLNVGVREALKDEDWDCLFLHDVDLIPENDHNLLPYRMYFGGVSALTPDQYMRINGFPNTYWGWGGEDDDISARIYFAGMKIIRTPLSLGHYKMITHSMDVGNEKNEKRFDMVVKVSKSWRSDGMNSIDYSLLNREELPLYTNITVDFGNSPNV